MESVTFPAVTTIIILLNFAQLVDAMIKLESVEFSALK